MSLFKKIESKRFFLILLLISCFVYLQTFSSGFVGDDMDQVYNYALVNSFFDLFKVFFYHHQVLEAGPLLSGYYKPLMLFYIYSLRLFFGPNPFIFHFIQIILVTINAFLVYILFSKFLKKNLSYLLAILFLIHPINQENAVYVSNIQDVLFFFFGMSALLLSLKKNLSGKQYLLLSILLLLSLLSKETGILFSIIAFCNFLFFKKKNIKKILFSIFGAVFLYIMLRFSSQSTNIFWIEPPPFAKVPFFNRLLHIPIIFFYYIKTFFYPDNLGFTQQWVIHTFNLGTFLLPFFLTVIFLGSLCLFYIRLVKKHFTESKLFIFFLFWFLLGIIPHLQIIPLDATVATRWFYFSSVGIIGLIGIMINLGIQRFPKKEQVIFLSLIFLCFIFSLRTMVRNTQWKDAFTLYAADAKTSQSALLENNLGDEYFKAGNIMQAQVHFRQALNIEPHLWIAVNNLGTIEEHNENYHNAYLYYKKALSLNDRLPMYENIARVLVLSSKNKEAETFIRKAIQKYPLSAKLWITLSLAHYNMGKLPEALGEAQKSYKLFPTLTTQQVIDAIQSKLDKK
ncbi:MAG: tetratricopeptide repeat protein [Candidatus Levyibacteriota bacterium]